MQSESLDVSIVIAHKDNYPCLHECLSSVSEQTKNVCYEIIIVDNGSTDDSIAQLRKDFPEVAVVSAGRNLGYGKGNNLGAKTARGGSLLFLNDDTVFKNNALELMINFMNGHPQLKIGALGPLLLDANGKQAHSFGCFPRFFSQLSIMLTNLGLLHRESELVARASRAWFPVDYVTGAALFVPRRAFEEMGGFDESFFLYFEETELQHRMAQAGYGRFIIAGPEIVHLGGGGRPRTNAARIETYRSMFLYYKKTRGPLVYAFFCIFISLFIIVHLLHPSFTPRENLAFVRSCWAAMPGTSRRHNK